MKKLICLIGLLATCVFALSAEDTVNAEDTDVVQETSTSTCNYKNELPALGTKIFGSFVPGETGCFVGYGNSYNGYSTREMWMECTKPGLANMYKFVGWFTSGTYMTITVWIKPRTPGAVYAQYWKGTCDCTRSAGFVCQFPFMVVN